VTLADQVAALQTATVPELAARYSLVFGRLPRSRNPAWLRKRIGFQMQVNAHGGLPTVAREALARLTAEIALPTTPPTDSRPNGLRPGAVLQRAWRGQQVRVEVTGDGFVYGDEKFDSLTAVAKKITGQHWSGPRFFGLVGRKQP